MSTPPTQTEPSEIAGRYQIVSRLGAGAFGTVYKAKDKILGRMVAIKTIRFDGMAATGAGRDELMSRFRREAQVSAQLRHPNIVTIYDVGEDAGISYLAMEFIDGVTLDKVIQSHGRLGVERAATITTQVADALNYAHQAGVVHRDIKPANIMIESGDRVKVADFGIAKSMNSTENLTMTGGLLGTPSYMSPEQARGGDIDGRTDLFALGCILYEALAGRKAFRGDSVTALIYKILSEDPQSIREVEPTVPAEIEHILARALAKDPAARYQSGREMADELMRLTQPGQMPTLRQKELPTSPVSTMASRTAMPHATPPTFQAPATSMMPPQPPTVVRPTQAPQPPPPPPVPPRQQPAEALIATPVGAAPKTKPGGGLGLLVGLGLAALVGAAVFGGGAWYFLRSKSVEAPPTALVQPSPVPVAEVSAAPSGAPVVPSPEATAQPTPAATTEPSTAPSTAPVTPAMETPTRRTTATTVIATPRPVAIARVDPPIPPPVERAVESDGVPSELDRPPQEQIDGSEAGRRAAEAYRSGGARSAGPALQARSPIPNGLNRLEQRVAVNLYNLALFEDEYYRRNGRYVPIAELPPIRRFGRFVHPGYRFETRIESNGFEIIAEPQNSTLRRLSVDDTRLVRAE